MKLLYWCYRCHRDFESEDRICPRCHSDKEVTMFDEFYICRDCDSAFEEGDINRDDNYLATDSWGELMGLGVQICPYCSSTRIEKVFREDMEDE